MVDFAGWEMPVLYSGVIEEHRAVRELAGLFDVSHMGEIRVGGEGAEEFLQYLTPNDVARLAVGQAQYSGLLNPEGGYLDDLLVYRLDEREYLLVVNASNRERDLAWVEEHAPTGVVVEDRSDAYALLALQGPRAATILAGLTDLSLDEIRYYRFRRGQVAGRPCLVSRTGYTGEDGFELYLGPEDAGEVWDAILTAGEPAGLLPAGLGARDTLRTEAGLALYGHELDEATTPYEAGLGWVVKLDKEEFIGRDALVAERQAGPRRQLLGFTVEGRGIARDGHRLLVDSTPAGHVTSGTYSPTFEKGLGMAFVTEAYAEVGRRVEIEVRGRRLRATLAELPFYRRS